MSQILITGSAGFIGSSLSEKFIKNGINVTGIDSFFSNYPRADKINNIEYIINSSSFSFYESDLLFDQLYSLLQNKEAIFHLAALPGINRKYFYKDYVERNFNTTKLLLDASIKSNVKHFFYISTSSIYGSYVNGDEDLKPKPCSYYGYTKYISEKLCMEYCRKYSMPVTILRYFSVYGPRQRPDMAYHRFINCLLFKRPIEIYGDGQQKRTNTYIDDCVNASYKAYINRAKLCGQVINIAGNELISVNEVIELLSTMLNCRPNVVFKKHKVGDQQYTYTSIKKAKELLDYMPSTDLVTGLKSQLIWQIDKLKHP